MSCGMIKLSCELQNLPGRGRWRAQDEEHWLVGVGPTLPHELGFGLTSPLRCSLPLLSNCMRSVTLSSLPSRDRGFATAESMVYAHLLKTVSKMEKLGCFFVCFVFAVIK